jgi:ketosteroid isomerase-like protein
MMQRLLSVVLMVSVTVPVFAQGKAAKKHSSAQPSKALMQEIWDGWSTRDPANVAKFYAKGPHVFFDIAPLKYNSWDEYQAGVKNVLAGYSSLKCTVNDDAMIHPHGNLVWGTATVHETDTKTDGSKGEGDFRWTVVWEKQGGEWLIVHEHVSVPAGGGAPEKKQ